MIHLWVNFLSHLQMLEREKKKTYTNTNTHAWHNNYNNKHGERKSSSHLHENVPELLTTTAPSHVKLIWVPLLQSGKKRLVPKEPGRRDQEKCSRRKTAVELRLCARTPVTPARTAGIFSTGMNPYWHSHSDRTRPYCVIIKAMPQK